MGWRRCFPCSCRTSPFLPVLRRGREQPFISRPRRRSLESPVAFIFDVAKCEPNRSHMMWISRAGCGASAQLYASQARQKREPGGSPGNAELWRFNENKRGQTDETFAFFARRRELLFRPRSTLISLELDENRLSIPWNRLAPNLSRHRSREAPTKTGASLDDQERLFQRPEPVVHILVDLILGEAVALLQLAFELLTAALDHVEIVVGEFAPLFLGLALELLPVTFNPVPIHRRLLLS